MVVRHGECREWMVGGTLLVYADGHLLVVQLGSLREGEKLQLVFVSVFCCWLSHIKSRATLRFLDLLFWPGRADFCVLPHQNQFNHVSLSSCVAFFGGNEVETTLKQTSCCLLPVPVSYLNAWHRSASRLRLLSGRSPQLLGPHTSLAAFGGSIAFFSVSSSQAFLSADLSRSWLCTAVFEHSAVLESNDCILNFVQDIICLSGLSLFPDFDTSPLVLTCSLSKDYPAPAQSDSSLPNFG